MTRKKYSQKDIEEMILRDEEKGLILLRRYTSEEEFDEIRPLFLEFTATARSLIKKAFSSPNKFSREMNSESGKSIDSMKEKFYKQRFDLLKATSEIECFSEFMAVVDQIKDILVALRKKIASLIQARDERGKRRRDPNLRFGQHPVVRAEPKAKRANKDFSSFGCAILAREGAK